MRALFDQLIRKPIKIMTIGPCCSEPSKAVSGVGYHWNLITMNYGAVSPTLSNRNLYPYFYRTYMSAAEFNLVQVRLMREYGWQRVASIHELWEVFSSTVDNLLTLLKEDNITIIGAESFQENPSNQVKVLKIKDAKIVVLNTYEGMARRVFCEAYKAGLTGKGYVWMIIAWYTEGWWAKQDDSINCTPAEMTEAVRGYLCIDSTLLGDPKDNTIANINSGDFLAFYEERLQWPEYRDFTNNVYAPFGYDAAWAVALTLNKSAEILKTKRFADNTIRRLEDFNYDDVEMGRMFFDLLAETDFIGATGPVSFRTGDRVGITQIFQLQDNCRPGWQYFDGACYVTPSLALEHQMAANYCQSLDAYVSPLQGEELLEHLRNEDVLGPLFWLGDDDSVTCQSMDVMSQTMVEKNCFEEINFVCEKQAQLLQHLVALYDVKNDIMDWKDSVIWPDGEVPLDHTPPPVIVHVMKYSSPITFYSMCTLSGVGLILALAFLGFNIKFKDQRTIKMSSPYLNNLIILGGILIYFWVVTFGLDTHLLSKEAFKVICHIRNWLLCLGFVLAFGAMFSKTWRVYRVVTLKTPQRIVISDRQLFAMVAILVAVDVVILTVWEIVDPMKVATYDLQPEIALSDLEDSSEVREIIQPYFNYCSCNNMLYFFSALCVYKGLLLIFGTFLAWETRKVAIPALNDSKYIGMSVYNVVILSSIGAAVSLIIYDDPPLLFIFTGTLVIFCTTVTLIVIFVPKVISVYKYPEGKPVTTMASQGGSIDPKQTLHDAEEKRRLREKMVKLEEAIRKAVNSGSLECLKESMGATVIDPENTNSTTDRV
ncbi:gamma-aminobutyric acid type B receptor subunit 2-like [Amphiura filiformis]|uniref:gamma-aminobutyric acid type B receptor subunit 2-like n=1 Tax=Amphiura filiformis TaxID=82378 RepID=UPI003B20F3BD